VEVASAEVFDDADQFVGAVAVLAGEADELFGAGDDGAAFGVVGGPVTRYTVRLVA
jgi:hypothetical protein